MKKKILFVGEASFLSTGFSTYYRELLPRLAETGKFEIGEIGAYARPDDPRINSFIRGRWKFWGTMPTSQEELIEFNKPSNHPVDRGQNINQFGYGIFDRVCAEFQPDIVISIRDFWMDCPIARSPFRPWFKWIWMACCDAIPQAEEWIQHYEQCDLMLAYSDFGVHTLKTQSLKIKMFPKPMRPGVDLKIFAPVDKAAIREEFCIAKDIPIIGTVVRNQSRKLTLDLIDAFALMKKKYKGVKEVDKSALLLHTIWPDNAYSFDYPRHVMRLHSYEWLPYHFKGIKDSVLQSLMCHACGKNSIGFAMNFYGRPVEQNLIKVPCMWCGQNTATGPTTGNGVSREALAKIYNLMDLYIQCTNCEGDGMPVQEAKACGVPTIVTDYSALSEKGRFPSEYKHLKELKLSEDNYSIHHGGDVFDTLSLRHEPETGCFRAVPDIKNLAEKMYLYITNHELRQQKSLDARKCVEENYDWDNLWKQWEFVIDNMKSKDRLKTWDSPIEIHESADMQPIPDNLSDDQYVEWLYLNVLKYPKVDPIGAKMWIQHLQKGVSREILMQQFISIAAQQGSQDQLRQRWRAQINGMNIANVTKQQMEWI